MSGKELPSDDLPFSIVGSVYARQVLRGHRLHQPPAEIGKHGAPHSPETVLRKLFETVQKEVMFVSNSTGGSGFGTHASTGGGPDMLHQPPKRGVGIWATVPFGQIMRASVERIEEANGRKVHAVERCLVLERRGEVAESREGRRLSGIEDRVVGIGREPSSGIGEGVEGGDREICWRRTSGARGRGCATGPVRAVRPNNPGF